MSDADFEQSGHNIIYFISGQYVFLFNKSKKKRSTSNQDTFLENFRHTLNYEVFEDHMWK